MPDLLSGGDDVPDLFSPRLGTCFLHPGDARRCACRPSARFTQDARHSRQLLPTAALTAALVSVFFCQSIFERVLSPVGEQ